MYTRDRSRPGGLFGIRRLGWLAVASMLALAMIGPATGAVAADNAKWFVCKYVGTPGVDETLQTGNNPISVSENAIPVDPVVAGASFSDSQGRSYVLVEDTGQDEPDPSECPPPRHRIPPRRRRRRRPDADPDAGGHADTDATQRRHRRRKSPTPTPTPTPEERRPPRRPRRQPRPTPDSVVVVWKLIDEDGDPGTDDRDFAAGWEFNLDTDATITDSEPVTGDGEPAWFQLKLSSRQARRSVRIFRTATSCSMPGASIWAASTLSRRQ